MNAPERAALTVDIVSDVVCPWCFVGKRRFEKAVLETGLPIAARWKPYQLDPTIPPEGKSRRGYMLAKFGSDERIREIHERLRSVGEAEGIHFAFDKIAVSPNTLDAHRLIRWAGKAGMQEAVVERLFRGYFLEGRDIGDPEILAELAAEAGMDRTEVAERLASAKDRAIVTRDAAEARQIGVTGVPTFILAGRYALVGAQPPEVIAEALRNASAQVGSDAPSGTSY